MKRILLLLVMYNIFVSAFAQGITIQPSPDSLGAYKIIQDKA